MPHSYLPIKPLVFLMLIYGAINTVALYCSQLSGHVWIEGFDRISLVSGIIATPVTARFTPPVELGDHASESSFLDQR